MGHEFMGTNEELGNNVKDTGLRKGQRLLRLLTLGVESASTAKRWAY